NALQTLLPQIRAEISEEFRTSSRPSDVGGNPPPATIHTSREGGVVLLSISLSLLFIPRYNGLLYEEGHYNYGIKAMFRPVGSKNLPVRIGWLTHLPTPSFRRPFRMPCRRCFPRFAQRFTRSSVPVLDRWILATAPVDAENWISHMEKIFDVMGCEDAFKTRLDVYKFEGNALACWKAYKQAKGGDERLKREYHSIRQTDTETSTEFMQRFFRLAVFLGAAAGTAEEQVKNFQWGLRRSTLNHLMCIPFTDVAQVANAACNYEILYERDDDGADRPDKR
nr:hypothetical protein [Tanacetum cinerariifolium]